VKLSRWVLIGLGLWIPNAGADLCAEKTAALENSGLRVISCSQVDFGVKAISGDYQKLQTQPVGVKPVKIRESNPDGSPGAYVHVNEAPGIKNSTYFNPVVSRDVAPSSEGFSLIQKYTTALQFRYPDDPELVAWMSDPDGMLKDLVPRPDASAMSGRCRVWSAWSLDPEIQTSLSRMSKGILCNEMIPFTRGELKELLTVLYPSPPFSQRRFLGQLYSHPYQYPADVEDANLALVKLGELGGGTDFTPDLVLKMASEAKSLGENMIIDIDPGREIWNQPVEWVVDVAYQDPGSEATADRTSAEFASAGPEGVGFLRNLRRMETELTALALRGSRDSLPGLCPLRNSVGLACAPGGQRLSEQADALGEVRAAALARGWVRLERDLRVRHKLFISYGVEGPFGKSDDLPSAVRELEYVELGDRKVWSPASTPLSRVCGEGYSREDRNSILGRFDVDTECARFKNGVIPDRKIITGALPPKKFETYVARAGFGNDPESAMKKRAYERLLDMMKHCESFDHAAAFLDEMNRALADNALDDTEVGSLSAKYREVSRLIDAGFLQTELAGSENGRRLRKILLGSE
jgi:hypothetical protein